MRFIVPLGKIIGNAINFFLSLVYKMILRIMNIQVVHYKKTTWFDGVGNGAYTIVMLALSSEITKTGKKIKCPVKIIDPERQAHIVLVKMQVV